MKIYKYKCMFCGSKIQRMCASINNIDVPPNNIKCRKCGNFTPRMNYI